MPAVAGLGFTYNQAVAKLSQYELRARKVDYETTEFAPGLVVQQVPAAGAEVNRGSYVELWVAKEPTTTTTDHHDDHHLARYDLDHTDHDRTAHNHHRNDRVLA